MSTKEFSSSYIKAILNGWISCPSILFIAERHLLVNFQQFVLNPIPNSHFTDRELDTRTNSAAREAASYSTIMLQLTWHDARGDFVSSTVWLWVIWTLNKLAMDQMAINQENIFKSTCNHLNVYCEWVLKEHAWTIINSSKKFSNSIVWVLVSLSLSLSCYYYHIW